MLVVEGVIGVEFTAVDRPARTGKHLAFDISVGNEHLGVQGDQAGVERDVFNPNIVHRRIEKDVAPVEIRMHFIRVPVDDQFIAEPEIIETGVVGDVDEKGRIGAGVDVDVLVGSQGHEDRCVDRDYL